jgi:hypothetical protein
MVIASSSHSNRSMESMSHRAKAATGKSPVSTAKVATASKMTAASKVTTAVRSASK